MWDLLNPDRHPFHGSMDLVRWGPAWQSRCLASDLLPLLLSQACGDASEAPGKKKSNGMLPAMFYIQVCTSLLGTPVVGNTRNLAVSVPLVFGER
ncbi:hypothetical protein F4677DRAFT_93291 [Hypoxylon crocopeplum]|nr:hypothetical protein F4677DRAFT_93291 [Hypoxylon crocopeplum]